jgi:hypothetical protein
MFERVGAIQDFAVASAAFEASFKVAVLSFRSSVAEDDESECEVARARSITREGIEGATIRVEFGRTAMECAMPDVIFTCDGGCSNSTGCPWTLRGARGTTRQCSPPATELLELLIDSTREARACGFRLAELTCNATGPISLDVGCSEENA